MNGVIEANYPISFRAADTAALTNHLRQHNNVSLIGMKRVGISNFLRFFLNHPPENHMFVVVDFNNLVEKTLYAFWMLTLKRLVDMIEIGDFAESIKEQSRATFTQSIQLSDPFFTLEAVRKLIGLATQNDTHMTIFFVRFDRLQNAITSEFLANLQGLRDAGQHLSYVFTSYRPLHEIIPDVFTRSATSGFLHEMYLKPAATADLKIILSTFQERHDLALNPNLSADLLELAGGHVQYLYLSLIALKNDSSLSKLRGENLRAALAQDEEVRLLSEELFTSFTKNEQDILEKVCQEKAVAEDAHTGKYLWDTGVLNPQIFSPLFSTYLAHIFKTKTHANHEMTKKEHLLFTLLKSLENQLVEREKIIETVWPDEVELGVSDWSIDRLVSRVRTKLKAQGSEYKIVTVITRGYKLVGRK